jgi:RNA polymerase sigma-70 factor (ECF subfamily)
VSAALATPAKTRHEDFRCKKSPGTIDYSHTGDRSRWEFQRMIDWEGILSQDGPAVWRTAWRVLGNRADADEVFQETFLAAVEYSRDHVVNHWRALLQRLATARAIDRLRQRVRRKIHEMPLPADHPEDSTPQPPQAAENAELSDKLRSALAEIPPRQAEVFCLFHLDGWNYPDIAEHQAISTDVVGVWLHRARGRLRELLREMNEVSR